MPQFGVKSVGLRVPGSSMPAWPWKDMVHVQPPEGPNWTAKEIPDLSLSLRKSKGHTVGIDNGESVLALTTQRLDVPRVAEAVKNVNTEEFLPPPPELRLPRKHFESGRKLQERIAPELSTRDSSDNPLFDSIRNNLSAFDRSQCETSIWTQKYAPSCVAEVLQSGREPFMLKEWLAALKVLSVDTGPGDAGGSVAGKGGVSKAGATVPKKKRKRAKLDGFVVSSDEEADEMGEPSDTEIDLSPSGRHGLVKKTVIRAGDMAKKVSKNGDRLTNAVVISGPHGCGKTAAVYAAARELDFEVFEINPSSRRSGKDVLERIGDMTKNHLVHHHPVSNSSPSDETAIVDEDVSNEVKAGKQATMNSFFKSKAPTKKNSGPLLKQTALKAQTNEGTRTPAKIQKQSLILLEEIDILYEEDKQFWATVMGLMIQSKRPFVMTCNDETLVPLQSLRLHGIFRFTPPPTDRAVDRLLMIAANEGHALRREPVVALYESRSHDFRASLMDLNYWCQIGVGDRRGGFDWFYLRWPKGVDVDGEGQVVRVVSEDTYQEGMGWLDHGGLFGTTPSQETEEEVLRQAWEGWSLDVGQWQDMLDLKSCADDLDTVTAAASGRLKALEAYDQFADAMSAADAASSLAFATANEVR